MRSRQQPARRGWRRAFMCSTPSYAKQVSSTSARILSGVGVMRRRMLTSSASFTAGVTAGTSWPSTVFMISPRIASGSWPIILKASNACPCLRYSGHAMVSYSSVRSSLQISATWRMMECTILDLL